MNVTVVASTPEKPEPHTILFDQVQSIRYVADSSMLDMMPGLQIRLEHEVHRFDLRVVLDVLVTP